MMNLQAIVNYLESNLVQEDVNQAAILLTLLENGGRATKQNLIESMMPYNPHMQLYFEHSLARVMTLHFAEQAMFTYDEVNQHYFLNSSMEDTFLIEQAIRLLHEHLNQWRNGQEAHRSDQVIVSEVLGKLVRDNIPAIIREDGRVPLVERVSGQDLQAKLYEKLTEEHLELLLRPNLDEIADVMEVLIGIGKMMGYSETEILQARQTRRDQRGSFDEGFVLTSVVRPK